jgi:hypothetical protein
MDVNSVLKQNREVILSGKGELESVSIASSFWKGTSASGAFYTMQRRTQRLTIQL